MEKCKHELDMSTAKLSMRKGGWIGKCKLCGEHIIFRRTIATGSKPYVNKAKKEKKA